MIEASNIELPLDAGLPQSEELVRRIVAQAIGVRQDALGALTLLKRSVDARKKAHVHFVASYAVELSEQDERRVLERGAKAPVHVKRRQERAFWAPPLVQRSFEHCPLVVGTGPAGLFCAWALARAGARPLVIERGQRVEERLKTVEAFNQGASLLPESNVQFGEGGAGTFSDGKLTTNIKNPRCADVLRIFADAGAPAEILWQAKPHIGTDQLVDIVRTLREDIVSHGGEVRFQTRFERARIEDGRVMAACLSEQMPDGTRHAYEVPASDIVLACGHSARDTFEALRAAQLRMERKPFSVGVRIEHPQALIDRAQYGKAAGHPALGAADYKLAVHLPSGRGVYTFCMCPGGEVVCAASEEGGVCVNGMSRFARDGRNANAAVLVGVDEADLPGDDVLAGVELQRQMEQAAFRVAGRTYAAPVQTVGDFLAKRSSDVRPSSSVRPTYARGVAWCDLRDVLPAFVSSALAEALPELDRRLHGFADPDAVLTGVETRSSSPVRIVRDKGTLQAFCACEPGTALDDAIVVGEGPKQAHYRLCAGLFPCGEGAGYAGGIMSAAVDGLRVAEAVLARQD